MSFGPRSSQPLTTASFPSDRVIPRQTSAFDRKCISSVVFADLPLPPSRAPAGAFTARCLAASNCFVLLACACLEEASSSFYIYLAEDKSNASHAAFLGDSAVPQGGPREGAPFSKRCSYIFTNSPVDHIWPIGARETWRHFSKWTNERKYKIMKGGRP